MFYLILAVIASTVFGACLKVSENRGRDRVVVAFFNYAAGFVLALAFWISPFAEAPLKISLSTVFAGSLAGAGWVAGLITLMVSIKASGIVLTTAISRLSVILPMAACVMIWNESISSIEGIGITLALGAALLLGSQAAKRKGMITSSGIFLLVLLVLAQTLAQISMKIYERYCPPDEVPAFMMILFLTGALLTGIWKTAGRRKCTRDDITFGILVGVPNLLSGVFQTIALLKVRGTIVFPVANVGAVFLLTILGIIIWKEKLNRLGIIGIVLTTIGLILINVGKGMK